MQLEVRHYGDKIGSFNLYDDDGVTFNYEKGEFSFTKLTVIKDKQGNLIGEAIQVPSGKIFGYSKEIKWKFMK